MTKQTPKSKTERKSKSQRGTFAQLAQKLGVSREAIENAISRGEITSACLGQDARGRRVLIDIDRAEADYRAHHAKTQGANAAIPPGVDLSDPSTWPRDLASLKPIRERYQALIAKQKSEVAAGTLVPIEQVKRDIFAAGRTVRDHLLRLPDRVSDSLAAALGGVDPMLVREAMTSSIERALADLSSELGKVSTSKPIDVESDPD
jgi:hypothetical protein